MKIIAQHGRTEDTQSPKPEQLQDGRVADTSINKASLCLRCSFIIILLMKMMMLSKANTDWPKTAAASNRYIAA
jgi:hypothetical protein